MKNRLLIIDRENSSFGNVKFSGEVKVELTPEWAMSVLLGDCPYFSLENENKSITPKYGYRRSSDFSDEILNIADFKNLLLQNPFVVDEVENRNFKTKYAVFENGQKWLLDSTTIGMIPRRDSDWLGKATYSDGNIWLGDSKND